MIKITGPDIFPFLLIYSKITNLTYKTLGRFSEREGRDFIEEQINQKIIHNDKNIDKNKKIREKKRII